MGRPTIRAVVSTVERFVDGPQLHTQAFFVEGQGGVFLDHVQPNGGAFQAVYCRLTSSVNAVFTIRFGAPLLSLYDRWHIGPGQIVTLPARDVVERNLTDLLLDALPENTRLQLSIDKGPATLRLWWRGGPLSF